MYKLKLPLFLLLFFVISVTAPFAGTIILSFHGQPGFNKVSLKWSTENEIDLKGFEVERGTDRRSDASFKKIDFVAASTTVNDKKEYSYEDKSVFKQIPRTFYYRLKIVDNNNSTSFSKIISVTPTISSARQTWGSIKAMFR